MIIIYFQLRMLNITVHPLLPEFIKEGVTITIEEQGLRCYDLMTPSSESLSGR